MSEVAKLKQAVTDALDKCNLPLPYKRGILNIIERQLRLQEKAEKKAEKLRKMPKVRKEK